MVESEDVTFSKDDSWPSFEDGGLQDLFSVKIAEGALTWYHGNDAVTCVHDAVFVFDVGATQLDILRRLCTWSTDPVKQIVWCGVQ